MRTPWGELHTTTQSAMFRCFMRRSHAQGHTVSLSSEQFANVPHVTPSCVHLLPGLFVKWRYPTFDAQRGTRVG
jgi:hypothetical protein